MTKKIIVCCGGDYRKRGKSPDDVDVLHQRLADARAEISRLNKQLDEFWEHLDYGWEIESRAELEKIAKEQFVSPNPLIVALHYIWKREAKTPEKDALIEQMRTALSRITKELEPSGHEISGCMIKACKWCDARAAIEASERNNK